MPTRYTLPFVEFNKSKNFKNAHNEYVKQSKYVFEYNVDDEKVRIIYSKSLVTSERATIYRVIEVLSDGTVNIIKI